MNPNPLISIIIPVYNVEPYLKDCLDSVINQTYKNLEIILVNDGSTDNSKTICEEYKKKDSRIILINQKNSGLSSARNAGIKQSTGEYISFIDSDDYVEKDYVEYLHNLVQTTNSKISICPHYEKTESGKMLNFNAEKNPTASFSVEIALKRMLNEKGFNLQATSKLFSSELFKNIIFPEEKLHEDVGTTYKLFLEAYNQDSSAKISFGSKPKYIYNLRTSSITNRKFNQKKMDLIELTDKMCEDIDDYFQSLKNVTNLRRIHARFSILRQSPEKNIENSLIKYIKEHRAWVLKNPEATKRDKIAILSLLLGKSIFKFAWKVYERRKK